MSIVVLYHGHCADGMTAAWVARGALGTHDAQYVEAFHDGAPPPDVRGKEVHLVDYCYKPPVLFQMAKEAKEILVYDHHKTTAEDLKIGTSRQVTKVAGNVTVYFDLDRSGAGITWDTLYGGAQRPWLVDYIEDGDIWKWKLPRSKEVSAWMRTCPYTFEAWDELAKMSWVAAADKGAVVQKYIDQFISEMVLQARWVRVLEYDVPIVNTPSMQISDVVGRLAEWGGPFAIGWFQRESGIYQYSLRSRGDFDVSAVARRFGGGGHKNAAGFTSKERIEERPSERKRR